MNLFPIRRDDDGFFGKCKKVGRRYMHPFSIATGMTFSAIGLGLTAAGVMYADGINFAIDGYSEISNYVMQGNLADAIDYMRGSYRGSMTDALDAGWKQVPLSYSVGHYVGGKVKDRVSRKLEGGRDG